MRRLTCRPRPVRVPSTQPRALPPAHRAAADAVVSRLASLPGGGAAAAAFQDDDTLASSLSGLGDLLLSSSDDDAITVALAAARSQPSLLLLSRAVLATRLVSLRTALPPAADAAAIARLGPWLLLEPDPGAIVTAALARMASLMPGAGTDVLCGRLAAGGTTWLSFSDVAQSLIRARRAAGG